MRRRWGPGRVNRSLFIGTVEVGARFVHAERGTECQIFALRDGRVHYAEQGKPDDEISYPVATFRSVVGHWID